MKKLMIVGAGGHGRVIADLALSLGRYEQVCFLDDRFGSFDPDFPGVPLVGSVSDAARLSDEYEFIIAIGNNEIRARVTRQLTEQGAKPATLVHPAAVVGRQVTIGEGTVVMAGAVVQTGTVIGKGCIINTGATVDHDGRIGDFCHISVGAHLAGTVTVGAGTFVCAAACIINNTSVCENCVLGAGSVAVRDITKPGTYVGVPARMIHD